MSFTMYSTSWCGYCKRLKSQLNDLGITFEEVNIEEVPGTAEIVERLTTEIKLFRPLSFPMEAR